MAVGQDHSQHGRPCALERLSEIGRRSDGPDRGDAIRSGLRNLARSPGLSAAIVLTLGVGIGANGALFGVLRGVLLRPLPYPEAERLVRLWETNPAVDDERHGPSPLNFVDWEASATTMESMTAWYLTSGTYRTEAWTEEIRSAQVTVDFFRTLSVLLSLFAAIGLILASTGVYGVIAYSVSHRRREIGVRMALGAEPGSVVGSVLRQAVMIAGSGFVLGLVAVVFLGRWVENVLFDVSPNDLRTTLVMGTVLVAVSAIAAYLPARRAASIAPSEALRAE